MSVLIDLDVLTQGKVHNLSGHERGLAARRLFNLDQLDRQADLVEIRVPDHIYGVSPSFLQGLFSGSVQALGHSREGFFGHYRLIATELVERQFDRGLSAILTNRDFSVN
jgi:hypothetical protein